MGRLHCRSYAMIADAASEIESRLAMQERGKAGGHAKAGTCLEATASSKQKPKDRTRAKTAKAAKVSERKMKKARAIRKKSPAMAARSQAALSASLRNAGRALIAALT